MLKGKAFKIFMNWTCNAGTAFYRMINFAKYMRKVKNVSLAYSEFNQKRGSIADWEVNLQEALRAGDQKLESAITGDIDMLMDVADVSVWQMVHTPAAYALFRAYRDKLKNKKPILMEIDDYIFGVNPESQAFVSYYPNSDLEALDGWQIQNAHGLIVSTPYLKEKYSHLNPFIEVVPNAIDFEVWDKLKNRKQRDKVVIGWSGGQAHYTDLKVISKVIPVILNRYKHVEFVFFGGMPDYIKSGARIKHVNEWYGIYDYPAKLAELGIDIGIAPLRDNQFNRAKSNLRWLEYSALKIPTVASPVEPFMDKTYYGLHALEVDEWVDQLSHLITNKDTRITLGNNAYNTVKKHYNVEKVSAQYLKILREFSNGKRKINNKLYDENSQGKMFTVDT